MKTSILMGTLALVFAGAPALAQTSANPAATPSPNATTTTAPAGAMPGASTTGMPATTPMANSAPGLTMADTAKLTIKFATVKPADLMSSRLVGINVYNNKNETLGEIDDLVIDNGKTISGVVIGVGGFLGMGESYVVVDPSTMVLNQKDGTLRAFVDTDKDSLKNAPKFSYSKAKKS